MRILLSALALLATTPALAQFCTVLGHTVMCDNGMTGSRLGNTIIWNDMPRRRGRTSTREDRGTANQKRPRTFIYNDRMCDKSRRPRPHWCR